MLASAAHYVSGRVAGMIEALAFAFGQLAHSCEVVRSMSFFAKADFCTCQLFNCRTIYLVDFEDMVKLHLCLRKVAQVVGRAAGSIRGFHFSSYFPIVQAIALYKGSNCICESLQISLQEELRNRTIAQQIMLDSGIAL